MLDLETLRAEFARYLVENTDTRWGMDAALMHVCRMAYEAGVRDGRQIGAPEPRPKSQAITPPIVQTYFHRLTAISLPEGSTVSHDGIVTVPPATQS